MNHLSYTRWDTTAAMNGCLTGLVSITAGCATVEPWCAFIIGIVGGWIYLSASALILRLKIDDAVDAIPVHLFGGAWGLIAAGLFSNERRMATAAYATDNLGWFYEWGRGSGNFTLMGVQLVSLLFVFGWTSCIFTPFWKVRVSIILSCECLCSICSLGDLATSFDLHLPLFNCLCKSRVLMQVSIISLSLNKS